MERCRIYLPSIVWDFLDDYAQQHQLPNRSVAVETLIMNAVKVPKEDTNARRTTDPAC
jgi:metal-responsive CopG/Arc/MetJ family transcriptional regulator